MITEKTKSQPEVLEAVVIRFVGDSGDGMQLTGSQFSDTHTYLEHAEKPVLCRTCTPLRFFTIKWE